MSAMRNAYFDSCFISFSFESCGLPSLKAKLLSMEAFFEAWMRAQGPTTLVSLLLMPMTTHTTCPVPSGEQAGVPIPVPPIEVQPDQLEPLKTSAKKPLL